MGIGKLPRPDRIVEFHNAIKLSEAVRHDKAVVADVVTVFNCEWVVPVEGGERSMFFPLDPRNSE